MHSSSIANPNAISTTDYSHVNDDQGSVKKFRRTILCFALINFARSIKSGETSAEAKISLRSALRSPTLCRTTREPTPGRHSAHVGCISSMISDGLIQLFVNPSSRIESYRAAVLRHLLYFCDTWFLEEEMTAFFRLDVAVAGPSTSHSTLSIRSLSSDFYREECEARVGDEYPRRLLAPV